MKDKIPYQRSAWCGQGWTLRAYRWKGELFAQLYMGVRCPLGILKFGSEGALLELASALKASVTMVSDAREPGEIRVLDTPVPHYVPEVKGEGWGDPDQDPLLAGRRYDWGEEDDQS